MDVTRYFYRRYFCIHVRNGFYVTANYKELRLGSECKYMSNNLTTNGVAKAESAGNNDPTGSQVYLSTQGNKARYIDLNSFYLEYPKFYSPHTANCAITNYYLCTDTATSYSGCTLLPTTYAQVAGTIDAPSILFTTTFANNRLGSVEFYVRANWNGGVHAYS